MLFNFNSHNEFQLEFILLLSQIHYISLLKLNTLFCQTENFRYLSLIITILHSWYFYIKELDKS